MSRPEEPTVEVAYALPDRQTVIRVKLAERMTALEAVVASGLLRSHEELRDRPLNLGIYGRPVPPEEPLREGDRVEVYRQLRADPREARRRLASQGRTMGPTGGTPGRG
jgi:putative ubiquitin-RnfH superfamily antitoxin RatB of RatAB toxin-antitoxin module